MKFPNDIDGDVMRRLEENGFNFEEETEIELNIDFDHWPLTDNETQAIKKLYPNCLFIDPDDEDIKNGHLFGYVQFYLVNKLEHQFIVNIQETITKQMKQYGGYCDSWGVAVG